MSSRIASKTVDSDINSRSTEGFNLKTVETLKIAAERGFLKDVDSQAIDINKEKF